MKTIIVTRHEATVQWLAQRGIIGTVIPHVTSPEQIRGCHVIGNVPLHLTIHAGRYSTIEIPARRDDTRGRDLSLDEMEQMGARLVPYRVERILEESL